MTTNREFENMPVYKQAFTHTVDEIQNVSNYNLEKFFEGRRIHSQYMVFLPKDTDNDLIKKEIKEYEDIILFHQHRYQGVNYKDGILYYQFIIPYNLYEHSDDIVFPLYNPFKRINSIEYRGTGYIKVEYSIDQLKEARIFTADYDYFTIQKNILNIKAIANTIDTNTCINNLFQVSAYHTDVISIISKNNKPFQKEPNISRPAGGHSFLYINHQTQKIVTENKYEAMFSKHQKVHTYQNSPIHPVPLSFIVTYQTESEITHLGDGDISILNRRSLPQERNFKHQNFHKTFQLHQWNSFINSRYNHRPYQESESTLSPIQVKPNIFLLYNYYYHNLEEEARIVNISGSSTFKNITKAIDNPQTHQKLSQNNTLGLNYFTTQALIWGYQKMYNQDTISTPIISVYDSKYSENLRIIIKGWTIQEILSQCINNFKMLTHNKLQYYESVIRDFHSIDEDLKLIKEDFFEIHHNIFSNLTSAYIHRSFSRDDFITYTQVTSQTNDRPYIEINGSVVSIMDPTNNALITRRENEYLVQVGNRSEEYHQVEEIINYTPPVQENPLYKENNKRKFILKEDFFQYKKGTPFSRDDILKLFAKYNYHYRPYNSLEQDLKDIKNFTLNLFS